jgi:hypothetical protein
VTPPLDETGLTGDACPTPRTDSDDCSVGVTTTGWVARERCMRWLIQGKRSPRGRDERLTAENVAARSPGPPPVPAGGGGSPGGGCIGAVAWTRMVHRKNVKCENVK